MNTVVDVSINKGAQLNCCTYVDNGKKIERDKRCSRWFYKTKRGGGAVRWEGEV
jgi:hypothetical protein